MENAAWPFLIGRTRTRDYRLVVVPKFMMGTTMAAALRDGTGGDLTPPESALVRQIWVPRSGPVTAVYRVRTAHAEDYRLIGSGGLADEFGRPIRLIEGFVVRRPLPDVIRVGVAVADLEEAHELVVSAYQAF